ncbi:hypothetical protein [Nonomuraea dietziae]|uniref:hypothetical protein n=1 Tax=Nonomuraea dietziae TaxID=65515 RepID=UPI0031DBE522
MAAAVPLLAGTPALRAAPPRCPRGQTAGYVVFDRVAGKIVAHRLRAQGVQVRLGDQDSHAIDSRADRPNRPARDHSRSSRSCCAPVTTTRHRPSGIAAARAPSWPVRPRRRRPGRHRPAARRQARLLGLYTSLSAYDVARTYRY